jgi:hypothetical protein
MSKQRRIRENKHREQKAEPLEIKVEFVENNDAWKQIFELLEAEMRRKGKR